MQMEKWKWVRGYTGRYQVSNHGRMRSWIAGSQWGTVKLAKPKPLKLILKPDGYLCCTLHKNHIQRPTLIHRLVANAFIKRARGKKFINHKDGNKANNFYKNLERCTSTENNHHALKTGLARRAVGSACATSALNEKQVKNILKSPLGPRELGRLYNVSHSSICNIRLGKTWNCLTGYPCTRKRICLS